ncbi:PREDICTED: zinc finger and BTB domain-containing protein 11-like isoform X1 [Nicrophorus vespilloides]|uniref:Zinc finger and BTB domain-containing protein 11-like isoform X1 n=1 Tax=Nicrophorus vespilloides TaxID=110193 RepID=A0ABM1NI21_NICVS|nr:PREDICTED: zinc finger and BTB domain-containing protein 11-like isoform X1 [Nicrophorus vespilloides]XP_017786471.1 PREDICTED: zinc finger and BTB domain-containing protein 11-like isoform X1 [Nicrophorus vespilloides]
MSINQRLQSQNQQPDIAAPAPSNMSCQRFCLRWNNHQSNLLSVFDQLLHDESFVDVTLAVEGQLLKAHKMVLSACSPYFQALFVNHPDKHPIVILKDVPYSDMRCLLDFMYRGEVSVDQDRLTAFLRVAESLRIKGLTEVNEEKCDSITSSLAQNQNSNLYKLQRLQPPQKYNTLNMLGHALLQPKRKRGRPRKLSGSSNGTPGADDFDRSDSLVQGSPEMLEVKMGMDGFTENNSDSSSGNKEKDEEEDKSNQETSEPVAGTSKETFNNAVVVKNENDFQASDDNIDFLENNQNHSNLPELPDNVTLDIVPIKYQQESVIISTEAARNMLMDSQEQEDEFDKMDHESESLTGIHFLTDDENVVSETYERKKNELLEYIMRDDGSVVCKLCGELLASRTHWYRHKYKFHVNNLVNPAPLFKCKYCNVFFKSRKGYLGHIASRHTEVEPPQEEINISIKEEIIESVELPKIPKKRDSKTTDWEEQRVKEEKLVAAIIARVRKECEAQGSAVSRRGYSRRSTVMMNTT